MQFRLSSFLGPDPKDPYAVEIRALNGSRLPFHPAVLLEGLRAPRFLMATTVYSALIASLKPDLFEHAAPIWLRIVFWAVLPYVYSALWVVSACVLQFVANASRRDFTVVSLGVHALPILICLLAGAQVASWVLAAPEIPQQVEAKHLLRVFLLSQMYEVIVIFALSSAPSVPLPLPKHIIRVGDSQFDLRRIAYLKSAEHYVEFHSTDGSAELHRVAMKEVISGMETTDGLQPHRSYWVPLWSIEKLEKKSNSRTIVLRSGDRIPVSRGRNDDVEDWFATVFAQHRHDEKEAGPKASEPSARS